MDKARLVAGIICGAIDILMAALVYHYGSMLEASIFSMILQFAFCTVGCFGVYIFVITAVDWYRYGRDNEDLFYGPKKNKKQ